MKKILFIMAILLSFVADSQPPLEFIEIGYEPAYCRLFGYQVGNGQVYAAATGGTPDYTYSWVNLSTGESVGNTTWGGLNPACYEVTVTDALGWTLVDTVCMDSLNPTAIIDVDADLIPTSDGFIGFGGQYVTLTNQSINYCNPLNPICDSSAWWHLDKGAGWVLHQGEEFNEIKEPWYSPGEYDVGLKVQNKNGCSDTAWVKIGIFGPVGTEDLDEQKGYLLYTSFDKQTITVQKLGYEKNLQLSVFDLGGRLIISEDLMDSKNTIGFGYQQGVYVYSIVDPRTKEELGRGKFIY